MGIHQLILESFHIFVNYKTENQLTIPTLTAFSGGFKGKTLI